MGLRSVIPMRRMPNVAGSVARPDDDGDHLRFGTAPPTPTERAP